MRFKTQWAGSITTTAGAAYTIPTATMALGSGSAAAELVQATILGPNLNTRVSANTNEARGKTSLGDQTAPRVAGRVPVSAPGLARWRSACVPPPPPLTRHGPPHHTNDK